MKAYQTSSNCRFIKLPSVNDPNNIPSPYANPFQVAPEYDNGLCVTENQAEFHTEWSDGHVHAAGFTTAWPPNKAIIGTSFYPGMDLDLNGKNEENGGPDLLSDQRPQLPPRRGQRPARRRIGPVRQELDRRDDLACAGHRGGRRGRKQRCLLNAESPRPPIPQ